MKTLTLLQHTFDQENTFTFAKFKYGNRCSLQRDYQKEGDGVYWAMQHGTCLKAHYTEADDAERVRLQSPDWIIADGEVVLIDGKQYRTVFKGNYSDCAIFVPVD